MSTPNVPQPPVGLVELRRSRTEAGGSSAAASSTPDAFRAAYLPDTSTLGSGAPGWRVDSIAAHGLQQGLEVTLAHAGKPALKVLIEPKSTFPCLASTTLLNLSHGDLPPGLDGVEAAATLRGFAALLATREETLQSGDIAAMFRSKAGGAFRNLGPIELRINRECNERCLFCNTPEGFDRILGSSQEVLENVDRAYDFGHRRVVFTGREPTLDRNLPVYIARARERGFSGIQLQTNATAFSSRAYLDELVAAGLTSVQVSFHTLDPATFETLIGPARLLDKALAGLDNLAAVPSVQVAILFVITTLNLEEMADVTARLGQRYPGRIREMIFSPMAPVGDGASRLDLLPRLDAIPARLERALASARASGMNPAIPSRCGLPLCLTPPAYRYLNHESRNPPGDNVFQGKSKAPGCAACRFDRVCGGVWDSYRETQGDACLVPVPPA